MAEFNPWHKIIIIIIIIIIINIICGPSDVGYMSVRSSLRTKEQRGVGRVLKAENPFLFLRDGRELPLTSR